MNKSKQMFRRFISGWAMLFDGLCYILTLGLWYPSLAYKFALVALDKGWA